MTVPLEVGVRFLEAIGLILYGGPLVAFSILLARASRYEEPFRVDRVYRSWGAGFGLGVTALFFGGLAEHWLRTGSLSWTPRSASDLWFFAAEAVFLALQVSYTLLEIWTNEPLRQLDGASSPPDSVPYAAARRAVVRHNLLNSALFLVVLSLWIVSSSGGWSS